MAALVQTYPQQTSTVTVFQTRPSSTAMLPAQAQPHQQYMAGQQGQRNVSGGMAGSYRGNVGPIQPYAFTSTPHLNTNPAAQPYGTYRMTSSPAMNAGQGISYTHDARPRHAGHASLGNMSYSPSMGISQYGSRDDSSITQPRNVQPAPRPQSAYLGGGSTQPGSAQDAVMKPAPDRYRRPAGHQPRQHSHGSGMPVGSRPAAVQNRPNSYYGSSADMRMNHQVSSEDLQRMRRRSMQTLDPADYRQPSPPLASPSIDEAARRQRSPTPKNNQEKEQKTLRIVSGEHGTHARSGSSESISSSRSSHSRPSSANRSVTAPTGAPSSPASTPDDGSVKQEHPKLVNIPPRGSSSDAAKRTLTPSPLSKPATMAGESAVRDSPSSSGDAPQQQWGTQSPASPASPAGGNLSSPAAQQLAAINQKGTKSKSKTSRLRRAFSFGGAADFEKATDKPDDEAGNAAADKNEPAKLHKNPTPDEIFDAEQEAIARKQEASGLGNSIYGGRFFTGSTDNISVSSTASSASIMIRKMGRGMKKSGRSFVGLFRPKSVVGVAPADGPITPEASQAAVSMVTVEAERVNVNPNPNAQNGGGTGFPHLERNSMDVSNAPSMVSERVGSSDSASRRSIVGGDRERAEVLAAVRKGILKHNTGTPSPSQERAPSFTLPAIPQVSDSPLSSAPSTPSDETHGHRRTGSVTIGSEDYFVSALKLRQDTKSAPTTPQGSSRRNATFSPRIVFHDTWPSQEYDRRGDIATCNRLTPMLAQQIKEELNTFKMEMEVHENSKIYTHFF